MEDKNNVQIDNKNDETQKQLTTPEECAEATIAETQCEQKNPSVLRRVVTTFAVFVCSAAILFPMAFAARNALYGNPSENPPQVETPAPKKEIASTVVKMVESVDEQYAAVVDVPAVAEKALPAMVCIKKLNTPHVPGYSQKTGQEENEDETLASASGVIFASDSSEILILTNAHVVKGAKSLLVTFCDNSNVVAYLKGYDDEGTDIAVLAVKVKDVPDSTIAAISCVKLGNSDELIVGQSVVAIGNALGYGQAVTTGIIGGFNRTVNADGVVIGGVMQMSAGISPGNSGGALLNAKGELIGVPTAKPTDMLSEGVGFAIPVNDLKGRLEVLSAKQSKMYKTDIDKVELGVKVSDCYLGVLMVAIDRNTIAYSSDLMVGDIIKQVNGETVDSVDELLEKIRYCSKGETITLTVNRPSGKVYTTAKITLNV